MSIHKQSVKEWAEMHFGGAELGDVRQVERVIKIGEAMANKPGKSIPQLCDSWYDVKATYQLLKNKELTPENIQLGHRAMVLDNIEEAGIYLLIEDTSELSWSSIREGLGPVGPSSKSLGFHLHTCLAVKWFGTEGNVKSSKIGIIGLADQIYHIRKPRPSTEPANNSKLTKKRERESQLWEKTTARIGKNNSAAKWIRVCDRGADIYEFLISCQNNNHDFIVRAAYNRVVIDQETEKGVGKLFDLLGRATICGSFELELRARPKQAARVAKLEVSVLPISLKSPQRPGYVAGSLPPIKCSAVYVREISPPAEVKEPIEWTLLCNREIGSYEQALEVVEQYSARWTIEDFHKALKTVLGAERLQLETGDALIAATAIMSVVALRLIDLRERVRINPDAAYQNAGFDQLEVEILKLKTNRDIKTVADLALAIGRLGGHLNRKGDGMPGFICSNHDLI